MKFKKYFKIKYTKNKTKQYSNLTNGSVGIKSLNRVNLGSEQMSAFIKSLKRVIKKKNFLIINALPFWSVTRKPRDVRMGRGKGTPSLKIFPMRAGKIILEIKNVNTSLAIRALRIAAIRLPMKTIIVKKENDKRTDSIKNSW